MLNNIVMIYQKTILNKINIFVTYLVAYKQEHRHLQHKCSLIILNLLMIDWVIMLAMKY